MTSRPDCDPFGHDLAKARFWKGGKRRDGMWREMEEEERGKGKRRNEGMVVMGYGDRWKKKMSVFGL